MKAFSTLIVAFALQPSVLQAQFVTLEPDNYTNGTVLNTIIAGLSLTTAGSNNLPIPPVPFDVKAINDGFGFAPTGQRVFALGNIPFWNNTGRLLMNFGNPISFLSIDFAGGNGLATETGELDVFDAGNHLLASYITQPKLGGQVETMSLSRPVADIAWAVAYVPLNQGSFGRLDNLVFSPVPEPSTIALAVVFLSLLAIRAIRRRESK